MAAKFKCILKRVAIGFALLLAGLLVFNGVLAWRAQQRLKMKILELRAAGEPTTLQELAPKHIPADENAAAQLAPIADDLTAWETQFLHEFLVTKLGESWFNSNSQGLLPSEAQLAVIEPILDAYPKILLAVDRAATAEQYGSLLNYDVSWGQFMAETVEDLQSKRLLANYVDAKMRALAAQGKRDEAVRFGIKLLQIARHYDQDPLLLNYFVSITIRGITIGSLNGVLQSGPVGPEARNELDAELAKQDAAKPLIRALKTERAASQEVVQSIFPSISKFLFWPLENCQAELIDFYNQTILAAGHPWIESHDAVERIQAKANSEATYAKVLVPKLKNVFMVENRNIVELRCLRVLNSLNGFLQANSREPANIQELGLPDTAVIDPFSGKPLKLRKVDKGWLVYSVYENEIDDGGELKGMKDWGLAPPGYEDDDSNGKNSEPQAD